MSSNANIFPQIQIETNHRKRCYYTNSIQYHTINDLKKVLVSPLERITATNLHPRTLHGTPWKKFNRKFDTTNENIPQYGI